MTREDEDAENHLLHNNDWMSSQDIVEDAKCGRFCSILCGNANLWCESIIISWVLFVLAYILQAHNIFTSDTQAKSYYVVLFIESCMARCGYAKSMK